MEGDEGSGRQETLLRWEQKWDLGTSGERGIWGGEQESWPEHRADLGCGWNLDPEGEV
jgi:hypothetical protein